MSPLELFFLVFGASILSLLYPTPLADKVLPFLLKPWLERQRLLEELAE